MLALTYVILGGGIYVTHVGAVERGKMNWIFSWISF
jgi:hypothetical protein